MDTSTLAATTGTPQSTNINTAFATALQVTLKDGSGNPLVGVVITFTVPAIGASATLSALTATTNASGQASVTATANGTAGSFTITASVGALSASFSLTNNAPPMPPTPLTPPSTVHYIATGADAGGSPQVVVFNAATGKQVASFFAFAPSFTGGVRVAVADLNGDGTPDIIAGAGPGTASQVIVIDGTKLNQMQSNNQIANSALLTSFFAFSPTGFSGGVYVAAGVGSKGPAEIVVGAGAGGGPQVIVIDATKMTQVQSNGQIANSALLASFFAFVPSFSGGVRVAVADINGDGVLDVIAGAGPGGEPQVVVIDGTKLTQLQSNGQIANSALLASFFAFAPTFTGGVFVSAGVTGGKGQVNLILSADAGGGPEIELIDNTKTGQLQRNGQIANSELLSSDYALPSSATVGVRVGLNSFFGSNPSRAAILSAAGPGGGPGVGQEDPLTGNILNFFPALPAGFTGGVFVSGG